MADSLENAKMNVCNSMSNESVAETSSSVVQNSQTNSSLSPVVRATISPTNCSVNAQQFSVEYLSQLVKDKKQLAAFPNIFVHMDRLVDEEISKVRVSLYRLESNDKESLVLPDPDGHVINLQEKVYIPVNAFPEYNFVGRILGPRGMTAKQLEQETGCKVMVRGKGSMRDRNKEEMSRGKPNWEHLSDDLHVLVQCEDTENRAKLKLKRAVDDIKRLLVPAAEGEDELKRKQLMELAIINGTYRPASQSKIALQTPRLLTPMTVSSSPMRSPNMGAPMILSPTRLAGGGSPTSFASVAPFLQGFNADFAAAASLLYNCSMDPLASWTAGAYPFNGGSAVSFAPPLMAAGEFHSMDSYVGRLMSSRR